LTVNVSTGTLNSNTLRHEKFVHCCIGCGLRHVTLFFISPVIQCTLGSAIGWNTSL